MKTLLGLLLIGIGIALGLYVGVWLMFVGGIVQIIEQIRAEHLEAMTVAIGIAKVMFAGLGGYLSGLIPCFIGGVLLSD